MVSETKKGEAEKLAGELKSHPVTGMADLRGLPSKELQEIRRALRGTAKIVVTKKAVITRALEASSKKGIEKLTENVHIPALILSDKNSFKLQKLISKSKSKAYAKVGDIAPYDLIIPAGDTNLPPGPAISDLQKAGVKSAIMGNKIVVREDSLVAKKGDKITDVVAGVLRKLDIKPMEIGMNVVAAYENGTIFRKDILAVSEEEYIGNVQKAYRQAFNLAYNADIFIKEIIPTKLFDAYTKSLNLAINANVINEETIKVLLTKANLQTMAVAAQMAGEAAMPAQPETKKAEEKTEEKKEEEAAAGLGALFG